MNYLVKRNEYILKLLLNKDAKGIDEEKYGVVLAELAVSNHIDDICAYIYYALDREFKEKKKVVSSEKILKSLTTSYCIIKAYEFIKYLEDLSNHQYEHDTFAR